MAKKNRKQPSAEISPQPTSIASPPHESVVSEEQITHSTITDNKEYEQPAKKTDYLVVVEDSSIKLQTKINEYISLGWTPLGGVSLAAVTTPYNATILYSQAIILWAN